MSFIRKNLFQFLLALAVIFLFLQSFVFSPQKIAYVDSAKLLGGYKAMVAARAELTKKQNAWKSNVDSLTVDVQAAIKEYEKMAATGTPNEKKMARELITTKQKQLYDYQAAIQQNAGQEEQQVTQSVFSTINAYLLKYGKKHNYNIILIAANGNIAYADDAIDLTEEVVKDLNNELTQAQSKK